jgi:NADP-dependent 3-hydroxy acid dehydrogenase YdfG
VKTIKGRKAVITGGSSGIGLSVAKAFLRHGAQTLIVDLKEPAILPEGLEFIQADITKAGQVNSLYSYVLELMGVPDILVCNAGRGIHEKISEGDPDKWAQIIDLNIMGTLRTLRAFLPYMEEGNSDIVLISSVSSKRPYAYGGVYSATKAAIDIIAETVNMETGPNVRVTVVSPGITDTQFFDNMISGSYSAEDIGLGVLNPDDISDAVLFAVSRGINTSITNIVVKPSRQA